MSALISLKSNVFWSRLDGGVVLRGQDAPVLMRGRKAHELVRAIVAMMARGASRATLLAQLPEPVRPAADRLIDDLAARGLLRERAPDDPRPEVDLPAHLLGLWNHVADHVATPGRAWTRWRALTAVIDGDPALIGHALQAVAETGIRRAVLADPALAARFRADYPELIGEAPTDDAAGRLRIQAGGAPGAGAGDDSAGWFFGPLGGHLIAGFVAAPFAARLGDWAAVVQPHPAAEARLPEQSFGVAAAVVAFGAFCTETGIPSAPAWQAPRRIDAAGRPTPIVLRRPPRIGTAPAAEAEAEDAPDDALAPLLDPVAGLFADVGGALPQVPLSVIALAPLAAPAAPGSRVFGWGLSLDEARRRAVRAGIAAFLAGRPDYAGAAIAVEDSAEAAAAVARGLAANDEPDWAPLPLAALPPEAFKLARLHELLTGAPPALMRCAPADGGYAKVRAAAVEACAPTVAEAAYRACGEACLAIQLGLNAPPAAAAVATRFGPPQPIDPGIASLAGRVFAAACLAEPAR